MPSQETPAVLSPASTAQNSHPSDDLKGSPLGKLMVTNIKPWIVILETALLPGLALLISYLVSPENPLWIEAEFPWVWLAPMIIALRYGPIAGLCASGVFLLGWLGLNRQDLSHFPQQYFLGGLIMVMIVGEVSSTWRHHLRKARTAQQYQDLRLEQLVRRHYLLRLSHEQLEQQLIAQPISMRDALLKLRDLSGSSNDVLTLLGLLSQLCQINTASIVRLQEDSLEKTPVAQIGGASALDMNDPLIKQALETGSMCHISHSLQNSHQTRYILAAPMRDLSGKVYGLLVVEEMPFFALQEETLQTINLLLGYYTDSVAANDLARPLLQAHPECPAQFASELQRMEHVLYTSQLSSTALVLEFSASAVAAETPQLIMQMERNLDQSWLLSGAEKTVLAILMPLSSHAASEGFMNRLADHLKQRGIDSLDDAGIRAHTIPIQKGKTMAVLDQIVGFVHA